MVEPKAGLKVPQSKRSTFPILSSTQLKPQLQSGIHCQQQIKAVYAYWCNPQTANKQQLLPENAGQSQPFILAFLSFKKQIAAGGAFVLEQKTSFESYVFVHILAKRTKASLNTLSLVWCSIHLGVAHNLMLCPLHTVLRHLKEKVSQHLNYLENFLTSPWVLGDLYLKSSRFPLLLDINAREVSN